MDGIKYAIFIYKSIRLLGNNQYTSNVESGSNRKEIKHWVEFFFGVMVIVMNSHRLPRKGRRMRGPIVGHTMHYRHMIITLQPGYSIPSLRKKSTFKSKYLITRRYIYTKLLPRTHAMEPLIVK
uniref:Large ribosomal subunit protein uL23c n=1 Tax=Stauntonia hexaphylla TaxID=41788 RepID=A0A7R7IIK8_9MAGN|nr:ribosomal protein L23 [Stauntonia hexaphylla]